MRILEIGVAGYIEVRSACTVDAPREDGIELWRLCVLNTFPMFGWCNAGITLDDMQGYFGDDAGIYANVIETAFHRMEGGDGTGRVACNLIGLTA